MCGICGFVGSGDNGDIERMNAVLTHRGPDAEGFWADPQNGIYLGHQRLNIIDIEGGVQPMWSNDRKLCVVYNGEIYNHLELRDTLETLGHRFVTDHSDTETLLYGYRQWGAHLTSKLNGMWAFAIYDKEHNQIFISRDRFGKKPLYYTLQGNTFAFASELSALGQHGAIKTNVSVNSLKKYFAYGYIPPPRSIYHHIFKLPAGYNLEYQIDTRELNLNQYWDFILEPFENVGRHATHEWQEEIRRLLRNAVERRLMSDVPFGFLLSGGIDSSAVAYYAANALNKPIKTFSIGFREKSFDESSHAEKVAGLIKSNHHSKTLSPDLFKSVLPDLVEMLDEPLGDSSILPTYLLCQEVRKRVTVAIGGDGADELFAGYDTYRALRYAQMYRQMVPRTLHKGILMLAAKLPVSHRYMSLDFRVKRALQGLGYSRKLWNPVWLAPLSPADINGLFGEPTDIEELFSEAIELWDQCPQSDIIDKSLQFYTKLYLQGDILTKIDRASMMHSLEVRSPFLDIELVDFVRRIPAAFKLRKNRTKYILKKALEPVLPHDIIYRPKQGFASPLGQWFLNGSLTIDPSCGSRLFKSNFVKDRIDRHCNREVDDRLFLWNFWMLTNSRQDFSVLQ